MEENPYKAPEERSGERHAMSAISTAWTLFLILATVVLSVPCLFLVDDTKTPARKAMFELSETLMIRGLGLLAAIFVPLCVWTYWQWRRA